MTAVHIPVDHPLSHLIAALDSTAKPSELVARTIHALAAITGSRAVLLYGWDEGQERLVVHAALPREWSCYPHQFRLGEGIVGTVALRGEPLFLSDSGADGLSLPDPAGPGATLSVLAVPVVSHSGENLGALCLLAETPSEFVEGSVHLASEASRLLATAIEFGRMRERLRKKRQLLDLVHPLAESMSQEGSSGGILDSIADAGLRLTLGTACAIYLRDRHNGRSRLCAASPRESMLPALWPEDSGWGWMPDSQVTPSGDGCAVASNPIPELHEQGYRWMLIAPIGLASERFGLIVAVDRRPRIYPREDAALFAQLARIAAVAVHNRQLLEMVSRRANSTDLMWEILAPGSTPPPVTAARIARLGCDLTQPRVVMVAGRAPRAEANRLRHGIQELDRTALLDVADGCLTGIALDRIVAQLPPVGVSIGISNLCKDPALYKEAYREAREALDVGTRLFGEGRPIRYEELGSYRFVPALVQSGLARDHQYQRVSRLPHELLITLEAYLDCGGNTVQAAQQLFLHRNTMRQRLDKIATMLDLDPTDPKRWLYLQLAIKAARMAHLDRNGAGAAPLEQAMHTAI